VLEDRLKELADELGIHPRELASAIKPLIPTASVASLAATTSTASGSAVSILAEGDLGSHDNDRSTAGKIAGGLGTIVGLDERVAFLRLRFAEIRIEGGMK